MMDKKAISFVFALVALLGCVLWSLPQARVLTDAESVRIVSQGHSVAVYDCLGEQEYHFHLCHSDAPTVARMAVQTQTIKIDLLPGGGLIIESDGSVYRITPKAGRCGEWLRKLQMKNY